ncbi:glycosyltransferase family 2 protein [Dokdonella sp. MW10]|uniref:glycosyltransferase family 2 protein n=1 Tax=Dokdonella sp. MW10 TaxID=2992926 RepID=UPI003F81D41F
MPATAGSPDFSLIIPVYKNEGSIVPLLDALEHVAGRLDGRFEVVFVVDGSPDRSYPMLRDELATRAFESQLLLLSRNFGSFAAIREGLIHAKGRFYAVMAADLQEPPELAIEFFEALATGKADVVLGTREARVDPLLTRLASAAFWGFYRRVVHPDLPKGGVDVFGCNKAFRDRLIALDESNSSLVGQIMWLGFRRLEIPYARRERQHGRSAWTFSRKLKYLTDSIYSFSDLPIRLLFGIGAFGVVASIALGLVIAVARLSGWVEVPGYAATSLIVLFFAALNLLGFGIVGAYVWRGYENTKRRPQAIVLDAHRFEGSRDP